MRKKILLLVPIALCLVLMSFNKGKMITVWMIGDSTMSVKKEMAYPETGWGMPFADFFNDKVSVENKAMNGRSTLSFITEKRWQEVYEGLKEGDYLIIEFGHNDEKIDKPGVGTTPEEYKINLAKFVTEARLKKAIPILMTPIARRNFKEGQLIDTHKNYPDVVRSLADSLNVPIVDMQRKTEKLLTQYGEEKSIALFNYVDSGHVNYPNGKRDNTHLSPIGAKAVADCAAEGIKELKLPLAKYLKH
jgi:lysophospholipase L1-like esterase